VLVKMRAFGMTPEDEGSGNLIHRRGGGGFL